MAEKIGINATWVSLTERGIHDPDAEFVYWAAKALGVSIEYLMGWSDKK